MFNVVEAFDKTKSVICSDLRLEEGMTVLIEYCASKEAWSGWDDLRKLRFADDESRLNHWLTSVLMHEPPSDSVVAYWFGLFNPVINGKTTCGLYVSGSTHYESSGDSFEWACDPQYFPTERYASSKVLDKVYKKVNGVDGWISGWGEYVLSLGFAGLVIKRLASAIPREIWLGAQPSRTIAIGFDSGDGILLGNINRDGWHPEIA